jgi:protein MpaA
LLTSVAVAMTVLVGNIAGGRTARASTSAATTRELIGHSVRGRAIYAYERGDPSSPTVLVVGSIHGNEPAGIAIAKRLLKMKQPQDIDLQVILTLNPDGYAARTRGNAHGVDLNRNFPWRWRRLTGVFYSGRHSLSEPESRAAYRLIKDLQPQLSIWFHQPLGIVSVGKGSIVLERRFSRLSGLPLKRLPFYPGTATAWERHFFPDTSAFVVELPPGKLSARKVDRYARAVLAVARS